MIFISIIFFITPKCFITKYMLNALLRTIVFVFTKKIFFFTTKVWWILHFPDSSQKHSGLLISMGNYVRSWRDQSSCIIVLRPAQTINTFLQATHKMYFSWSSKTFRLLHIDFSFRFPCENDVLKSSCYISKYIFASRLSISLINVTFTTGENFSSKSMSFFLCNPSW